MSSFSTGLSALSTSQRALEVIGNNIANANTTGYHRQVARLASRIPTERLGLSIGSGVEITNVQRLRSSLLESAFTQHSVELGDTTAQLDVMRQVESLLSAGEGSVHDRLEAFFNQLEQLSARPDDTSLRRVLLGSATALTDQFNSLAGDLGRIRVGLDSQVSSIVNEINPLARQIAELNGSIQRSELSGVSANDLRDQRDQLVNELADRVGIQVQEQDQGQIAVLVAGLPLVVGNRSTELNAMIDQDGHAAVTAGRSKEPLEITGGKLGGLLKVRNETLPNFEDRLHAVAHELIQRLDAVHATGLRLTGPMTFLSGDRAVSNTVVPLSEADLAFPPQAGSLFITVTELATGKRTLGEVVIDPATQSLQDVAAAISGVGHIQALADSQTRTLTILAQAGYAFDFAGRLDPAPATTSITGTSVPKISGVYSGTMTDTFTFQVVGSGTIGVTPNLSLQVRNSAGSVVASLNIGQGYEPGTALQVVDGVAVSLASGTANDGDTFSTRVVAEPDTSGILSAFGLNTFFSGKDANDIHVQTDLISNPAGLAASRTGQPGDGSNSRRMASVRDLPLLENGTHTLSQSIVAMVGDVGTRSQELEQLQSNQQVLGERIDAERQSVSGVDPNEELVKMVEFQRSFQMASRYISAVNESLDDLFRII